MRPLSASEILIEVERIAVKSYDKTNLAAMKLLRPALPTACHAVTRPIVRFFASNILAIFITYLIVQLILEQNTLFPLFETQIKVVKLSNKITENLMNQS